MGHAFWTCPLKVAGVGSSRLARIIGFLGCTQCTLIYTKSFQVFTVEYCTVPKNAEMSRSNLNICKENIYIRLKN